MLLFIIIIIIILISWPLFSSYFIWGSVFIAVYLVMYLNFMSQTSVCTYPSFSSGFPLLYSPFECPYLSPWLP